MRLVLFLLVLTPTAAATGGIELLVARLQMENSHTEDCLEEASGLCFAEFRGDSLGSAEMDGRQNVSYLGIGLNESRRTFLHALVGRELLPGGDLVYLDAGGIRVPNPATSLAHQSIGEYRGPHDLIFFWFSTADWGWGYTGPGVAPIDTEIRRREVSYPYTDSGMGYGTEGGFNDVLVEYDTDSALRDWARAACTFVVDAGCAAQSRRVSEAAANQTPRVLWSLEFHDAHLASTDQGLAPRRAPRADSPPDAPVRAEGQAMPPPAATQEWARGPPASPGAEPPPPAPPRLPDPPAPWPHEPVPPAALPDPGSDPEGGSEILPAATVGFLLMVLAAALYARIGPSEALASLRRRQLLQLLAARGRLPIAAIARELGVDWSTARHHVRVLQRSGSVVLEPRDGLLLVGLPGARGAPEAEAPAWRRLLAIVETAGGEMRRDALHEAAGDIPLRTRNHAMRRLIAQGDLLAFGDVLRRAPAGGAGA